jgi:hypothetical protein
MCEVKVMLLSLSLLLYAMLLMAEISHWTKKVDTDTSSVTCQDSGCFMIDRRSNLSLREFIEKYDGKR